MTTMDHPSSYSQAAPQDPNESPVTPSEIDNWEATDFDDLVLGIARFRLKGFHHAGDAAETILWERAFTEAKGE